MPSPVEIVRVDWAIKKIWLVRLHGRYAVDARVRQIGTWFGVDVLLAILKPRIEGLMVTRVAGFDSPNAQNGALNVQPGTVTIEIVPRPGDPNGDSYLEQGTALNPEDPDTVVIINGTAYDFEYLETGVFPGAGSGSADSGDKVPATLEGKSVAIIRIENYDHDGDPNTAGVPQQFFFTLDYDASVAEIDGLANSGIKLASRNQDPDPRYPCFEAGSLIATPTGRAAVESLEPGDLVLTRNGPRKVLWRGETRLVWPGDDELQKPVLISTGALAPNSPSSDLVVSQQHHVVMKGSLIREVFGCEEVLAPAKGLLALPGVRRMAGKTRVVYVHVLLEQHELVDANGANTETFYPGPTIMSGLRQQDRDAILGALPALREDPERGYGPTALPRITVRQTEELVRRMKAEARARSAA